MYLLIKIIHIACAVATISGFVLRGVLMMKSSPLLQHKLARILPHVIDTVFLVSGISMLWMISLNPFTQAWMLAKFAGLVGYILLGTIAIKRGRTLRHRALAFVAALVVFAYIVGVALARSPASWMALP